MKFFATSVDISYKIENISFNHKALRSKKNPDLSQIYVHLGEKKQFINKNIEDKIYFLDAKQLLRYTLTPLLLGRKNSAKPHDKHLVLDKQLSFLCKNNPSKKHFKIAIINGYGANLGDSMIGATAMRAVSKVLAEYLKNYSIDLYMNIFANRTQLKILENEPCISNVNFHSLDFQTFCQYDAYFDFSNILNLPNYTKIPTVDWFLWWFGLNPSNIDDRQKRNKKLTVDMDIKNTITKLLAPYDGNKMIFFNPRASVPLRSCPFEIASNIANKILKYNKQIYLISDLPLEVKNKRFINLYDSIDTAEKFIALVSLMDGLISVNTFSAHLSDAFSIPSVIIDTSLPSLSTKYYPYVYDMLIPNAKSLPGWLKFKNISNAEYEKMRDEYEIAWENLDIEDIMQNLAEKIKEKGIKYE